MFIAGLYSSRGASHRVLRGCLTGQWTPIVSVTLAAEYEDVLLRGDLSRGTALTQNDLETFLDGFLARCELVEIFFLWRPNFRDEGDNHVLEAAVAGNADAIVTHNVKDFHSGELRFERIRILTPGQLLGAKAT